MGDDEEATIRTLTEYRDAITALGRSGKRSSFSGQVDRKLSVFEFDLFAVSPEKISLSTFNGFASSYIVYAMPLVNKENNKKDKTMATVVYMENDRRLQNVSMSSLSSRTMKSITIISKRRTADLRICFKFTCIRKLSGRLNH